MKKIILPALFILFVVTEACNSKEDQEDNIPTYSSEKDQPLYLGHRGTGSGVNNGFIENTIPAIVEALKWGDGVEVDIQMSASNTPWIFHDDLLTHLCPKSQNLIDSLGFTCILNSPDSIITKLKICREGVEDRVYKLEELLTLLKEQKGKIASLDIKGYFGESCVEFNNVSNSYLDTLATQIYTLVTKKSIEDQVVLETNYSRVFEKFKNENSAIKCHYLAYNNLADNIEKTVDLGLDGISFNLSDTSLTATNNSILLEKGLQLQLWTINNQNDVEKTQRLAPFSLQVGNINLLKAIHSGEN